MSDSVAQGDGKTAELLPCPFCGGIGELFQITGDQEPSNEGGWVICCMRCAASSRVHFSEKDDARPHVIAAWNERAPSVSPGTAANKTEVEQ